VVAAGAVLGAEFSIADAAEVAGIDAAATLAARRTRTPARPRGLSLRLLNEGRKLLETYRAAIEASSGPSRVATAVLSHHGPDALRAWHTAFGTKVFDRWRYPDADELYAAAAHALATTGLPVELADVARE